MVTTRVASSHGTSQTDISTLLMTMSIPSELDDAPTRAVLVYHLLQDEQLAPATKADLVEASRRSPSTVKRALRELETMGLVESTRNPTDQRQRLYRSNTAF